MNKRWSKAQKAEIRFWDELDLNKEKERIWKMKFIQNMELTYKIILDIGCGPRGVIHYINNAEMKIGVDPLIDSYRKKYKLDSSTTFIKGVSEKLPLNSKSMDVVYCINVLDHVFNPNLCLKEIHRVLKPGGSLIFVLNTYPFFIYLSHIIKEKLSLSADVLHPYSYTLNKIKKTLTFLFKITLCKKIRDFGRFQTYYFLCVKQV